MFAKLRNPQSNCINIRNKTRILTFHPAVLLILDALDRIIQQMHEMKGIHTWKEEVKVFLFLHVKLKIKVPKNLTRKFIANKHT